jgi:hypothetical protein
LDGGTRDTGDHGIQRPDLAARVPEPHDPVIRAGAQIQVDQPVPAERRGHRDPQQPALAVGLDPGDGTDSGYPPVRGHPEQPGAVAFGDQRVAARQEGDRPRHRQIPYQHGRLADMRRGLHGAARRWRAATRRRACVTSAAATYQARAHRYRGDNS